MRKLLSFIVFALAGVALVAVPAAPAQAAPTWFYTAWTGATYANVLNSTVNSDLTAQSAVAGTGDASNSNSTAGVDVTGLASVGAAQTRTTATNSTGGVTVTSWARTAGVSLLDGLISADALETTTTSVGKSDGTLGSVTTDSKLVNLKIVGIEVPLNIPKNWSVTIPGVATVNANYTLQATEKGQHRVLAWALGVQLLKARNGYGAGATIVVNPLAHNFHQSDPEAEVRVGGFAFATRAQAKVGDAVKIVSDPTAFRAVPIVTSDGAELSNSTASVNVPGLLTVGAVKSSNVSSRDEAKENATVTSSNQTAKLNLLGGLITADAIGVTATGSYQRNAATGKFEYTSEMKMTTVNLVIAGQEIPIDVSPNTKINVAGLGLVEINKQVSAPATRANLIYGLRITLDTAQAGLPVGAVVELAVAHTIIYPKAGS